jgi:TonB family protein
LNREAICYDVEEEVLFVRPTLALHGSYNLVINNRVEKSKFMYAPKITAASYGGSSAIPVITIDDDGRITAAEEMEISRTTNYFDVVVLENLKENCSGYSCNLNPDDYEKGLYIPLKEMKSNEKEYSVNIIFSISPIHSEHQLKDNGVQVYQSRKMLLPKQRIDYERQMYGQYKGITIKNGDKVIANTLNSLNKQPPESKPIKDSDTLVRVAPKYPIEALLSGTTGFVTLALDITRSGAVKNAKVIEAYCGDNKRPCTLFNEASIKAVLEWKFKPKILDGKAITYEGKTTIEFNL